MIDKAAFGSMRKELQEYDQRRDQLIRESRDVTKESKMAISALQRGDSKAAKEHLKVAETVKAKLDKVCAQDPTLRYGAYSASLEEYAEAKTFLSFLEKGKLVTAKELGIEAEEYLLGLCDLTGELVRYTVLRATAKDAKAVKAAREIVDAIHTELLQFDLRNGELRKKYDSVKYNLQKIENVLYELTLK